MPKPDADCRQPIKWKAPSGEDVLVELLLNFNVFTGYAGSAASSLSYFGPQCQGVVWPASQDVPLDWPISPPIVIGKVFLPPPPNTHSFMPIRL